MEDSNRIQGFTLLELMVAIAVLGTLMASLPSLSRSLQNVRIRAMQSQLLAALSLARSAAVSRHQRITLCNSQDGRHCESRAVQGTVRWRGVLVFVDSDHDRICHGLKQILSWQSLSAHAQMQWNRGEALSYQPDGSVTGYSNGTFRLSGESAPTTLDIIVSLQGRVRVDTSG